MENLSLLTNRAGNLIGQGKFDEAIKLCRSVLAIAPNYTPALVNLACALLSSDRSRAAEAKALLQTALRQTPGCLEAWIGLAECELFLGNNQDAINAVQSALAINPYAENVLQEAGRIFLNAEKPEMAAHIYVRALEQNPTKVDYWIGLANALDQQDKIPAAAGALRKSLFYAPDRSDLKLRLAQLCPSIPFSWEEINKYQNYMEESLRRLCESEELRFDDPLREYNFVSSRHAYYAIEERNLHELTATALLKAAPSLERVAPHCVNPESRPKHRRIRIGVMTCFTLHHIVGQLAYGISKHFDRRRFEVIGLVPPRSLRVAENLSKEVFRHADRVVKLEPNSFDATFKAVSELELDVFFPLDVMMDPVSYYLSFARVAHIQCTTWGHPLTTGIPNVDYYLSCEDWETSDSARFYSECLVKLKHQPMFILPLKSFPKLSRQQLGLPESKHLYVCPQSLFKLHPDFDSAFISILNADKDGVLVLLQGTRTAWATRIVARILSKAPHLDGRIIFSPRLSYPEFLNLYAVADAVLDPWHWSGGNTTVEALGLGQPVVTLPGRFMRGRLSEGFYRRLGLEELIAQSPEDYVAKNLRLVQDKEFASQIRQRLSERLPALYEDLSGINELQNFFEVAYKSKLTAKESTIRGEAATWL